jgi:hypothetical protein
MTIFYWLRFETPWTWRARCLYSYPPGTGWPGYTSRHWVPFSSPPTTLRAVVEVFDPASAWHLKSLSLILRPTVSPSVSLGIKHPSVAYDQIFITISCWLVDVEGRSLTRGLVQLLLALASAVIFGPESPRTCDHILLSQIRDFPFRRLLRLARLRWRYSTPPPHGRLTGISRISSC